MKRNWERYIENTEELHLSREEKAKVRSRLVSYMKANPVRALGHGRLYSRRTVSSYWSYFISNSFSYMVTALIIALILGGSVSAAAEQSLPGDLLYPVKTEVNEEMRAWVAFSTEAKAKWDSRLAERRIEEAEKLAIEGKLGEEVRARLESKLALHARDVHSRVLALEAKSNIGAAVDVSSDLESKLEAHEAILLKLASKKAGAAGVAVKVRTEANEVAKKRAALEAKLTTDVSVEAAAEGKLKAAEAKLEEVGKFIESMEERLTAEAIARADAKLGEAFDVMAQGKVQLESDNYKEAFLLFQKAMRVAQEAKLSLTARNELKVDLKVGGVMLDTATELNGEATTSESADGTNTDASFDADVETEVDGNSGDVNGQGSLRLKLGL